MVYIFFVIGNLENTIHEMHVTLLHCF